MSDPIKSTINEINSQTTSYKSEKTTGSSLDKDSFLQLLVTQMKYQDPLNPNTDTQYVAQLATFSQLEQMQNLNQSYSNSQAFGLVGMNVVVKSTDSAGKTTTNSGTVDSVVINNGKAQLVIGGNLYTLDQLQEVIDSTYMIKQGLPYIPKKVEATFDKSEPKDITFEVNLGKGETVATDVAIVLNGKVISDDKVSVKDNKVTISKDVFEELENGTYKPTIVFNDALYTTISNEIVIEVKGEAPPKDPDPDADNGNDTGDDSGDGSDKTA
ncbi:flagellar hook capping FlgD N-terminal domain-containing protein [Anaerocolumna sp. AGMB13025]|uniref:flagellar hook capping FlgD N-terminal domain-containing protein n=1 Tax=Anaerocolumna sp. AGMB13025 TaxID=3039116 RepID=UPI00241C4064|nr:flagellar hook capping FlgD N-terminal domain-containing protein [Anaerocolumna sp. AGMB13025]WFR54976.1 flagellar hook capping FlgD N-terminal domain-containing protein [Anaerocolumna sp. AGMB13025]